MRNFDILKTGVIVIGIVLSTSFVNAQENAKNKGKNNAFREAHKAAVEEHRQTQKQENKELISTLKGKSASEICTALKENRVTQHAENTAFCSEEHSKRIEYIKEKLKEKGLSDEEISAAVTQCDSRQKKRLTHRESQYEENISLLETLAKDENLDAKELREKLKTHRQAQKKENEEFRSQMKNESGKNN